MDTGAKTREFFTTSEAAAAIGVAHHVLLYAYRSGRLAEPRRHGDYRLLTKSDVSIAALALREKAGALGAILFIEKEGFLPLFKQAHLAERFDIAIMSTKGVSVTAARKLVDEMSGQDVPCLVLRDFDKAGFTIVKSLRTSGRRYTFRHRPLVNDLGLRLADVEDNGLASESVFYARSNPTWNLRENGATPEEVEFLCPSGQEGNYTGQRVELNAFTSGDLLSWVEGQTQRGWRREDRAG